jgi:hypothetical protein
MEHLAAVQLPEDLQNARDLAPRDAFPPLLAGPLQEPPEVALARVFEREAVQNGAIRPQERERVEDADRPGMPVEQLPEVRLAQPSVDPLAGLDANDARNVPGSIEPGRQVGLPESALANQAIDAVMEPRLRADDHLRGHEQEPRLPKQGGTGHRPGCACGRFSGPTGPGGGGRHLADSSPGQMDSAAGEHGRHSSGVRIAKP